jgi:hypothetical protein
VLFVNLFHLYILSLLSDAIYAIPELSLSVAWKRLYVYVCARKKLVINRTMTPSTIDVHSSIVLPITSLFVYTILLATRD